MFRTIVLCLLLSCAPLFLHGQIIEKDGVDHILVPVDLVIGKNKVTFGLDHARAIEISDNGQLEISKTYKQLFKFDDKTLAAINQELRKIELAYFKHVHQVGKFTKLDDGGYTIKVSQAQSAMNKPRAAFKETLMKLLNKDQLKTLEYFDITILDKHGKFMFQSDDDLTITLTPPPPADIPQGDLKKRRDDVQARLVAAQANGNHDEIRVLIKELNKLGGFGGGNKGSYQYSVSGKHKNSSTTNWRKPKPYIFYERAILYHKGELEDFIDLETGKE